MNIAEQEAEFPYLSVNFLHRRYGNRVFAPYRIVDTGGKKIALIGICTPETYTKSTPGYFKGSDGEFRYTFCEETLYSTVQQAVGKAKEEGAQTVVVLGHLGIEGITKGWRSVDVIANTKGIDVFIDGHSHEKIPCLRCQNKEGSSVLLTSAGEKFADFGKITILSDGTARTELISTETVDITSSEQVQTVYRSVQQIADDFRKETSCLDDVVGVSEVTLTAYDPCTGDRAVRNCETNLGDFVADAYCACSGADFALVNGGRIRASLREGIVTRRHMTDVNPWNNEMCVIKICGQQVLDALEHGARMYPEECGGFLQSSGLTYEIDLKIQESPVVTDERDLFLFVNSRKPRKVKNVRIKGRPIDPENMYTVVGSCYMLLDAGDGFSMFEGAEIIQRENLLSDTEMLVSYLRVDLHGRVPRKKYQSMFGERRIVFSGEEADRGAAAVTGFAVSY